MKAFILKSKLWQLFPSDAFHLNASNDSFDTQIEVTLKINFYPKISHLKRYAINRELALM